MLQCYYGEEDLACCCYCLEEAPRELGCPAAAGEVEEGLGGCLLLLNWKEAEVRRRITALEEVVDCYAAASLWKMPLGCSTGEGKDGARAAIEEKQGGCCLLQLYYCGCAAAVEAGSEGSLQRKMVAGQSGREEWSAGCWSEEEGGGLEGGAWLEEMSWRWGCQLDLSRKRASRR